MWLGCNRTKMLCQLLDQLAPSKAIFFSNEVIQANLPDPLESYQFDKHWVFCPNKSCQQCSSKLFIYHKTHIRGNSIRKFMHTTIVSCIMKLSIVPRQTLQMSSIVLCNSDTQKNQIVRTNIGTYVRVIGNWGSQGCTWTPIFLRENHNFF